MAAEPMFRAPRPEMASESNLASCACAFAAKITAEKSTITTKAKQRIRLRISAVSSNYKAEVTVDRNETIHGHSCAEESLCGRRRLRPCLRGGQREMCVFQEHVLAGVPLFPACVAGSHECAPYRILFFSNFS